MPDKIKPDTVAHLPLNQVRPDPEQPRKDFDAVELSNLATDIRGRGVMQPITVRPDDENPGGYLIVMGERRYRASVMARMTTIPCLLYTADDNDPLQRLMDQVKENHLRADFNPIEWANFFYRLHKTHKLKYTEIEKTLADQGISNKGRSYISNIIRLVDLPEWAQEMIRNGRLSGAHGKYMLPAIHSEAVMESLHEKFTEIKDVPWQPTTRDIMWEVYHTFARKHKALTGDETHFDFQVACVQTGCQQMRKVNADHAGGTFCLNTECWKAHQKALKSSDKQDSLPQVATTSARQADANNQAINDKEKDEELLEQFIRDKITQMISADASDSIGFLLWVLALSPDGIEKEEDEERLDINNSETRPWNMGATSKIMKSLIDNKLISPADFIKKDFTPALPVIVEVFVDHLYNYMFPAFIKLLGITIEDYTIDNEWLSNHSDNHLRETLNAIGDKIPGNASRGDLILQCKLASEKIGVPAGIRNAWDELVNPKEA